jgi:GNAT superfamily N-acetyltransferase
MGPDAIEFSVRPFKEPDFAGMARIIQEQDPKRPATELELRHWDGLGNLVPEHLNLKLTAELSSTGEMIGWGTLAQPSFNFTPGWYWIWVAVSPKVQARGVGGELFDKLEQEARNRNALGLWANTRENDARGVRFLHRREFAIRRRSWQSRLDLEQLDLANVVDRSAHLEEEGFRFTTLHNEAVSSPGLREELYRLVRLTDIDIPRMGNPHPFTFEEFVAMDLEAPGSMPDGVFLAFRGPRLVGTATLQKDLARSDSFHVGYTGTHPNFRGRGVATELKRREILFARERGVRYLLTGNDSSNRPIVSINQRLGFRPEAIWIQGEKRLANASGSGGDPLPEVSSETRL